MTPITYDWLLANGFTRLPRLERQPTDHVQRAIAAECIGDRFMTASEDLCIDMAPTNDSCERWHCWVAKAHSPNLPPIVWVHVRMMLTTEEVELLYEGLTGRKFASGKMSGESGKWRRELGTPIFEHGDKSK